MANKAASGTKKILVVDDEEGILQTLKRLLVKTERQRLMVITAFSGEEALEKLAKERIDLVVTDVMMPGMNGLELLVEIKNRFPYTPVIVMTAYPSSEIKRATLLKGGLHLIEKPFDINALREMIVDALQESSQFRGMLTGISLNDLIQIKCMSGVTDAMRVTQEERQGIIYFDKGEIIHAICDDLDGEEAFYEIISFARGHLDTVSITELPERTINLPYVSLLLEGARRLDERGGADSDDNETLASKEKIAEPIGSEAVAPAPAAAVQPESSPSALGELLGGFKGIRGYRAAAVFKSNGEIVVQDAIDDSIDLGLIGDTMIEFFSNLREASDKIGLEPCHEAVLVTLSETLIMGYSGGGDNAGYLVLTIFEAEGNHPLTRSEMRRVVRQLSAGKDGPEFR